MFIHIDHQLVTQSDIKCIFKGEVHAKMKMYSLSTHLHEALKATKHFCSFAAKQLR